MKTFLVCCTAIVIGLSASLHAAAPKKPATSKKNDKPEKVDPAALLKKFDEDNDGKLDKKELSAALKSLKHNSITTKNDSWKRFDTNGDGKIDLNELKKLLEENK